MLKGAWDGPSKYRKLLGPSKSSWISSQLSSTAFFKKKKYIIELILLNFISSAFVRFSNMLYIYGWKKRTPILSLQPSSLSRHSCLIYQLANRLPRGAVLGATVTPSLAIRDRVGSCFCMKATMASLICSHSSKRPS